MEKFVSPKEWNDIIQSYEGFRIYLRGKEEGSLFGYLGSYMRAYIEENRGWATLTIKRHRKEEVYKCALCADPNYTNLYTFLACQQIGKYVKPYIHILNDIVKKKTPDGPNFRYYNKAYEKKVLKVWSYDINSAYPFCMIDEWPDTTKPLGEGILENDEIGFNNKWIDEGNELTERLVAEFEIGKHCRYRFKKMPCPDKVKEWILKYYEKKAKTKDKMEKAKYKAFLVVLAGELRNFNPFVRATFLTRSMNYVKSFFDNNTIYANVDCIYSLKPRTDLPFGNELGQFKEEIKGEEFIFKGAIHGTNADPRWQGIPRSWVKGSFIDLVMNDMTPPNQNIYEIDTESGMIRSVNERSRLDEV